MESSLVSEFVNSTGCDIEEAYVFLRSNNWDLRSALDLWTERKNASSPENYDMSTAKKLSRGISRASTNINYVCEARNKLLCDKDNNPFITMDGYFVDTQGASFILPDFSKYPVEFQAFLEKDLIDLSTKKTLESSSRLNWWLTKLPPSMRLYPLSTTGDGNCLLHSVSLSMFGFHDRLLFLRQLEHEFITDSPLMQGLKRRWKYSVHKVNLKMDVVYSPQEWDSEWQQIVEIASTKKKMQDHQGTYESLEEIHILALAHMLRRVIIVIADTMLKDYNNQPFAPITIGGIYIPYECDSKSCCKTPLLISYDVSHFSSLVFMEKDSNNPDDNLYMIPVVDVNEQLLPLRFPIDLGPNFNWDDRAAFENVSISYKEQLSILKEYLDIIDLSSCGDTDSDDEPERPSSEPESSSSPSKATKQLQSFGKQFGSIGKSMGKKLRRNFGSLTRLTSVKLKKADDTPGKFLVATVNIKKFRFHEEMTKNYLEYAKEKFMREYLNELEDVVEDSPLYNQALEEGIVKCTSGNECKSVATVVTSYLCLKCYDRIKQQYFDSQFGIGKSKFYRETDMNSYRATQNIPVIQPANKCDKTLYLSNSTFFNDSGKDSKTDSEVEEYATNIRKSFTEISIHPASVSATESPSPTKTSYNTFDTQVKQIPMEIGRLPSISASLN
ncbi:OTU domain-containing protein 7B-like isoform X2 [Agrilus planipennis]|uniref:ubiquitinyl hydrolase 1 n=1 Tax=Agrilus planipennis TaxID=224129 RepID=A0A1W4WNX4_AGRPL|nr:OTU domain-containing protein 7B-like isoform X2 [Agrilus planipennis]